MINSLNLLNVSAKIKWQDSKITVNTNDKVLIQYLAGEWTANPDTGFYDANGNSTIKAKEGYTLPDEHEGVLCGRVGETGEVFLIGNRKERIATSSGNLFLCINDDLTGKYGKGFSDNEGIIIVSINIQKVLS